MPVALITGISGQDGSYLAESLLADGYDVHGIVRAPGEENLGGLGTPDALTLHTVDLLEPGALERVIGDVRPDELFSLAAISSVFASWQNPVGTGEVNGQVVVRMLDSAYRLKADHGHPVRVVHASSAEIFGQAEQTPQTESTPIAPTSPYGASK